MVKENLLDLMAIHIKVIMNIIYNMVMELNLGKTIQNMKVTI